MRICNFISKRAKSKKFCIFEKVYRIYNFSSNFDLSFLELIVLIASSSMWSKKCKFSKIACFSFNYNAFFFSFFFFLWKATSMNKVIYFSLWKGDQNFEISCTKCIWKYTYNYYFSSCFDWLFSLFVFLYSFCQSLTLAVARWPTSSENWFEPVTFAQIFQ